MIVKKPSIFIYTNEPDGDFLSQICAGIEEEGVFYEIIERDTNSLQTLAFDAAQDSMLGSGIGVTHVDVALHMRGLPRGQMLESYHMPTYDQCRTIGANSARMIKKLPLKN